MIIKGFIDTKNPEIRKNPEKSHACFNNILGGLIDTFCMPKIILDPSVPKIFFFELFPGFFKALWTLIIADLEFLFHQIAFLARIFPKRLQQSDYICFSSKA